MRAVSRIEAELPEDVRDVLLHRTLTDHEVLGDAPVRRTRSHRGEDLALALCERVFLYLPFEHAEDRKAQELAVERFRLLAAAAPERARARFASFLDYAIRHREVIERFGRFPHRNPALGRASTPEERAWVEREGGF